MKIHHFSEREFSELRRGARPPTRAAALTACFHFSGPGSGNSDAQSTTSTTDRRIGATDNAVVATDGSNVGGLTISNGAGTVSLTTADPKIIDTALATVRDIVAGAGDVVKTTTGKTNELLSQVLDAQQTGGASQAQKNVLAVTFGGAIALVAVTILARKKS